MTDTRRAGSFVGRQREFDEVVSEVEQALGGAHCLVRIAGEAGIGKTRLCEEVSGDATRRGVSVVWASCVGPGAPAYWPWAHVVHDCSRLIGEPPPGRGLVELLETAVGSSTDHPEQARLQLFEAVVSLLERTARHNRTLIVLDDLHQSDISSIHLLLYLAQRMRGDALAIVATHRYPDLDPSSALAGALGELARAGRALQLVGLGRDDVGELMRVSADADPDAAIVPLVHERTRGNPLFVLEIARLMAAQGQRGADRGIPVPDSVRQVIGERLSYVSAACLDALSRAAVCGQQFSLQLLEATTGTELDDLLDEAQRASLVTARSSGVFEFSHPLVREVLYLGIPAAQRRTLHGATGRAIEDSARPGDRIGEVAHHFSLAVPDVDAATACDYARRAGRQALDALAYEEAASSFARALDLIATHGGDEQLRVELLLALGDARMRAGDWPGAVRAYEDAAAAARARGRADELARAALGLGAGLSGFEVRLYDRRQLDLLKEALTALGDEESELRAWVLARLSVAASYVETVEQRIELSRRAIAEARAVGNPKLIAYALSSYCDAIAAPAHSEERRELATEMIRLGETSGDAEAELLGRRFRLVAMLEMGDIAGVDAEIEAFAGVAHRIRSPLLEWYVPLWRGVRALIEGRVDESARYREEAAEIGRRANSVNASIVTDVLRLQELMETGRWAEGYEGLRPFLDDPEGGPNAEAWVMLPLARMGRRTEAQAILDRLAGAGFPLVVDGAWLEVIAGVADACATLGDANAAGVLVPLLEPYADRFATGGLGAICFGSMSRFLGRLEHVRGYFDEADAYFVRALDAHRRAGATLLIAHTLRERAALLVDRGAPGDAALAHDSLAESTSAYRELGLDVWIEGREAGSAVVGNVLRREGDVWLVSFGGADARVKDVKGVSVIARLLASPGREFHVLDLAVEQALSGRLGGDTGEVVDAEARAAYKRRLDELDEEIADAEAASDGARVERARSERDAIADELGAAYGLGGRVRRGHDPAERARSTVTKQIANAIGRFDKVHPDLARHLGNSIRTGRYCSYQPEQPIVWEL